MEEVKETKIPSLDELLKNEDFKKTFNSHIDSAVSKGVQTYKDGAFNEAVKKEAQTLAEQKIEAMKNKTPEQLEIEEMKKNLAKVEKEREIERLNAMQEKNKNLVLGKLSKSGLPSGLADYVVSSTEEDTIKKLDDMTNVISEYIQNLKAEGLKNNNIEVPHKELLSTDTLKVPSDTATEAQWEAYFAKKKQLEKQK